KPLLLAVGLIAGGGAIGVTFWAHKGGRPPRTAETVDCQRTQCGELPTQPRKTNLVADETDWGRVKGWEERHAAEARATYAAELRAAIPQFDPQALKNPSLCSF